MAGQGDPSLPEIARRLDEVFARLEKVADDLPRNFVSRELYEAGKEISKTRYETVKTVQDEQTRRITALEDDKTWLYRLIVGAVILALVSLAFVASHAIGSPSSPSNPPSTGTSQGSP